MKDILLRQIPFGQYEFVDVTFDVANTDVVVPFQTIQRVNSRDVHWIDVRPSATSGGTVPQIYKLTGQETNESPNGIILRCTVAGYRTRLLLFTERD